MENLSLKIGENIRKYRKLNGLTLEKLAEILNTETNYLGQCERGERRFSLDKMVEIIDYFGITANDIIPFSEDKDDSQNGTEAYITEINDILSSCSANQLAVILNILKETVPFLKN